VSASETPDGILWLGLDSRPDKVSSSTVSRLSGTLRTVLLEIANGDITKLEAYPRQGTGTDVPRHHIPDASGAAYVNNFVLSSPETSKRREVLEKIVAELWRRILGVPPNHGREDFFDAGGDSLLAVRLMSQLCRHLDRELPVALFFKDPTVAGVVSGLMENNSGGELDYAIVKLADGVDGRVVFVSTGQDGLDELAAAMRPGPSIYRLDAYFLQEQRLLAGQPILDSVEAIATEFRYRLKAIQPKGPYLLAGGCEGGVFFYELALQLQQRGDEVALLGMLDTPVRGFWDKPAFLGPIREAKRQFLDFILRRPSNPKTPGYERFQYIWAIIWQAVRSYHPERLFDGDVHQFKATNPILGNADVASGWERRITGRVRVHMVPGNHLSWITNPQSSAIISTVLDTVVPAPVILGAGQ
jgi:thioesterase domain-containing protein/acyl carrier protein